jgi:molybdopterin synthase sulfur carrier subunit
MATVRIPTPMRPYTNGERITSVSASTLAGAIEELRGRYPGLANRLVDASGQLHDFVNVFVNDQDVRLLEGLATPLDDRAEISIIPAMAGGCGSCTVSLWRT